MRRTDGRAVMPSPSALLSDSAHVFPGKRAPCVSADAFEDLLCGTRRGQSCPHSPFLCPGVVLELCRWGGGCAVTWPGSRRGPVPGPTAFPRPTLFLSPAKT